MTEGPAPARLIRKIVIGYELNALPPSLIRSLTLLRGKLSRKRFKVEVVLRPLDQLPADTDVLFVAADLVDRAKAAAPAETRVRAINVHSLRQPAYDELLAQLEAGQEIYAVKDDEAGAKRPVIVRYRGHERIS